MENKKRENRIIFDWLSFTSTIHTPEEMVGILGLKHVEWQTGEYGRFGYTKKISYKHIDIYSEPHPKMNCKGIFIDMSGQGCRVFEDESKADWKLLFMIFKHFSVREEEGIQKKVNITRLDVAYDDFEKKLDFEKMVEDCLQGNYTSKYKTRKFIVGTTGTTLYFGSRFSQTLFRFYDKAKEQKIDIDWIRAEMSLKQERALEFVSHELFDKNVGQLFNSVLLNYVKFLQPSSDQNKSRWEIADYWSAFIGEVCKISLCTDLKPDLKFSTILGHVQRNYRPLQAVISVMGLDWLCKKISDVDVEKTKYERFVDSYDTLEGIENEREKYTKDEYYRIKNAIDIRKQNVLRRDYRQVTRDIANGKYYQPDLFGDINKIFIESAHSKIKKIEAR